MSRQALVRQKPCIATALSTGIKLVTYQNEYKIIDDTKNNIQQQFLVKFEEVKRHNKESQWKVNVLSI